MSRRNLADSGIQTQKRPSGCYVAERVGFEHLLAVAKSLAVTKNEPDSDGQDGRLTSGKAQVVYGLKESVYRFGVSHVPNCIRAEAARYSKSQDWSQVGNQ